MADDTCLHEVSGNTGQLLWIEKNSPVHKLLVLVTDIHVPVRSGQQATLLKKLRTIQKLDEHTFPGTVARYVVKSDEALTALQILFIWKSTEMPDETTRNHDLEQFQEELSDVLEWETAQYSTNEAIMHT